MAAHDDQWDMPYPRFAPTSSYNAPVVPPSVDPDGGTLVQVPCLAREWIPYLLGALDQLRLPSAWRVADDDALLLTLQRVANLRDLIASWKDCEVLAFRCEPGDDMSPQYSTDGGATWIDLPDCFIGPPGATGATGATGPPGTFTPGDPANPRGDSTATQACSLAGYLANQFVKASLSKAISDINAGAVAAVLVTDIIAAIAGAGVFVPQITAGVYVLYAAITGGTMAHYTDARDSSQFWSDVTCSINSAIAGVGFVNSSNFAALLTALASTPYVHADVVSTVHDYVSALGVDAVREIQAVGAVAVVDCSACGGPSGYVAEFNGSDDYLSTGARVLNPGSGSFSISVFARYSATSNLAAIVTEIGNDNAQGEYHLRVNPGTQTVFFGRRSGGAANVAYTQTSAGLTADTWHHIAVVWSGGSATIYIDGVAVSTTTGTQSYGSGTAATTNISNDESAAGGAEYLWKGAMSDLRLYASALSSSDVAAIQAGGRGAFIPVGSPAAWWKFAEGAGATAHDSGSGAHNATWHGTGSHWGTL